MNNQREIYEALLAGETLTSEGVDVFFKNGELRTSEGIRCTYTFVYPEDWQIYKEPAKWYENIPDGGVLCVCGTSESIRLIESFVLKCISPDSAAVPIFRTKDYDGGDWWYLCRPATKQEIQVFMENAPEDL